MLKRMRQSAARLALAAMVLAMCPSLWSADDRTSRVLNMLDVPVTLVPTKLALIEIDKCRTALPPGQRKDVFSNTERVLIQQLLMSGDLGNEDTGDGWQSLDASELATDDPFPHISNMGPPKIYVDSLLNDAKVCANASAQLEQSTQAQGALDSVIHDLAIKSRDCAFHGAGRTIKLTVWTMRGQLLDQGWTVYFKWLPVGGRESEETAFPKPSAPTFDNLPPGLYRIRAEKRDPLSAAVSRSQAVTCEVDEIHRVCEVQVP
jgi:hypothetical protein